jgi:FkbM family methyltransferase
MPRLPARVLWEVRKLLGVMTEQERRGVEWFRIRGDDTLRVNYPLTPDSIVFDLGGYKGEWSWRIFTKYGCTIHIFEPVNEYYADIVHMFNGNPKIRILNYGLAGRTRIASIYIDHNRSSLCWKNGFEGKRTENIQLKAAAEYLDEYSIKSVDLMKVNIEGCEYDLLPHLIESGLIRRISNIQIQFHDIERDSEKKMRSIQKLLHRTHKITWQHYFIWENWARRDHPLPHSANE